MLRVEVAQTKADDTKEGTQDFSWLGTSDEKDRENFMVCLATKKLPMPQTESDWHAARVYVDSLQKSVYDVEQWRDFLQLKNKLPIDSPRRRERRGSSKSSRSSSHTPRPRSSITLSSRLKGTPKPPPPPGLPPREMKLQRCISMLVDMGFTDITTVEAVAVAYDGDFHQCLNTLLSSKQGKSIEPDQKAPRSVSDGRLTLQNRVWNGSGGRTPENDMIIVSCGACKSQLKVHNSTCQFVCGVCRTRCALTHQQPCPGCGCKLKFRRTNPHVMCPGCGSVIDTRSWSLVPVTKPEAGHGRVTAHQKDQNERVSPRPQKMVEDQSANPSDHKEVLRDQSSDESTLKEERKEIEDSPTEEIFHIDQADPVRGVASV
eukprot:CAMPEP_0184488992 /NCGR_PEP_ID=MMETSP0113_2-20130426/14033_1 /TAXON_ID=91329 /ORGANISM="Norrisiella sphaerica, Strain BC52" /LENGTH=373 /DNA_ID=CAMNT_0026872145 /DNA_START=157 /DNA_END=1278 /DNA_ORIENTATION=+